MRLLAKQVEEERRAQERLQIIQARLALEEHERQVREFNLGLAEKDIQIQQEGLRIQMSASQQREQAAETARALAKAAGPGAPRRYPTVTSDLRSPSLRAAGGTRTH